MKRLFIYINLIWLCGCSNYFLHNYTHPDLKQQVDMYEFEKNAPINIKWLIIDFADLNPDVLGKCYTTTYYSMFQTKIQYSILINKTKWPLLTQCQREIVMFHELGHCDLNRSHSEPLSIMEIKLFDCKDYVSNRDYYLDELFGNVENTSTFKLENNNLY